MGDRDQMPKVTFRSREMYDETCKISNKIPFWKTPQENPINQFVPASEMPFKVSRLWLSDAEIAA